MSSVVWNASRSCAGSGNLNAHPVRYHYRYCPSCRTEWPADRVSCPQCVRWLGDAPLERIEWQLAPSPASPTAQARHEVVAGCAIVLRVASAEPSEALLNTSATALGRLRPGLKGADICEISGFGWFLWQTDGLRRAFLSALEIEKHLLALLPELEKAAGYARLRWGMWLDQYVLGVSEAGFPAIAAPTARAIFCFEPDNMLFASETVYRANRQWEHFMCVPRRRLKGGDGFGYRLIQHKRPSALDHAQVPETVPFIGRGIELALLDETYKQARDAGCVLGLIAPPGAGKTRLIGEWRRRHSEMRIAIGRFSLFGGDVVSLASQLADLPPDRLDAQALIAAIVAYLLGSKISLLVIDDVHWADAEGIDLLRRLLAALESQPILILLVSRPAGLDTIEQVAGSGRLCRLAPLGTSATAELARSLISSEAIAEIAAARSQGNPLFVGQFAAWADEAGYDGVGDAPSTLHQVIAARIAHLSENRLDETRQKLRWGFDWQRREVGTELERIETEIGLWLDRLETGDYADRLDVARYLLDLERLDFDIFILGTLAGRPRSRSDRLREAIERLLVGSGEVFLAALTERAEETKEASRQNVHQQALRAGDYARNAFKWRLASLFYALACKTAPLWSQPEALHRLRECRGHLLPATQQYSDIGNNVTAELQAEPSVDFLALPAILARLAADVGESKYYWRAAAAAEAIGDHGFAEWERRKASE